MDTTQARVGCQDADRQHAGKLQRHKRPSTDDLYVHGERHVVCFGGWFPPGRNQRQTRQRECGLRDNVLGKQHHSANDCWDPGSLPRRLGNMDQLVRRTHGLVLLILLISALSSCAIAGGNADSASSPRPPTSASPTSTPNSTPPTSLRAEWVDAEELLGEISSAQGTYEVGPVSSDAGRVVIYVKCYGTGVITVELVGSATFDQQCLTDPNDPGTRNQIQANSPDDIVVRGSAETSNIWAIAVTDGEPIE